jgi:hypothetical protein
MAYVTVSPPALLGARMIRVNRPRPELDQVVGEDPCSHRSALPAVQAGAVPAETAFEAAGPAFTAGTPFDQAVKAAAVLDGLAGR